MRAIAAARSPRTRPSSVRTSDRAWASASAAGAASGLDVRTLSACDGTTLAVASTDPLDEATSVFPSAYLSWTNAKAAARAASEKTAITRKSRKRFVGGGRSKRVSFHVAMLSSPF